jgi:quercetin dioxygenase-like cupin family protein
MPTIIDLNAEATKLATLREQAAQSGKRTGQMARLGPYRDGILLLGTSLGTGAGHWESHPEDELVHMLEGSRTLEIVCDDGPPKSFELRAGTVAVIPQGAWHRFQSVGVAMVMSATLPGPHVDLDVDDPRPHLSKPVSAGGSPRIIDLGVERAKLTMFHGMTPQSTFAERKGSAATLGPYRDGILFLSKWSGGKTHWETHPADELVHVLEGSVTFDIVEEHGPQTRPLHAGAIVMVPANTWHRFRSAEDYTGFSVTVPGPHIELDVDDPRPALREAAKI